MRLLNRRRLTSRSRSRPPAVVGVDGIMQRVIRDPDPLRPIGLNVGSLSAGLTIPLSGDAAFEHSARRSGESVELK